MTKKKRYQRYSPEFKREALKSIGRASGEPSSSVYHQLTPHGGIETPAERINAGVALTG